MSRLNRSFEEVSLRLGGFILCRLTPQNLIFVIKAPESKACITHLLRDPYRPFEGLLSLPNAFPPALDGFCKAFAHLTVWTLNPTIGA